MDKVELLAPAGNMDSLKAAVENGADAVYIGGKKFSARQYAGNFDNDDIKKAVDYCHIRGVKVYITLNILLKDNELYDVPEYVAYLYSCGVDALIIQDMGVGKLIRDIFPDFELHASTQMTAHNLASVDFLYNDLGYKRVVLSRELSIDQIEIIASSTKAEIEVFAHGALCICYSGQCLMSSMIGGRSGNRGRCAQPCRQKYKIGNGKNIYEGYIMSPKDLCTAQNIDSLIRSGVKSLKVEGRMKRPEYVAAVISVYRRAIDDYYNSGNVKISDKDKKILLESFNRGGFTTAYLFGRGGKEMMSFERPKNWGIFIGRINKINKAKKEFDIKLEEGLCINDGIEIWTKNMENIGFKVDKLLLNGKKVERGNRGDTVSLEYRGGNVNDRVYKTSDYNLLKSLEKTYKSTLPVKKIPLKCNIIIRRNENSTIILSDADKNTVKVSGRMPESAINKPLDSEKVKKQICKLGGTPFFISSINVMLDDGLSLPLSSLNMMRRESIERITKCRMDVKDRTPADFNYLCHIKEAMLHRDPPDKDKKCRISVYIKDSALVDCAADAGCDIIIFGGDKLRGHDMDYKTAIKKSRMRGKQIFISSPRIIKGEFESITSELLSGMEDGADGIYADNMGILKFSIDNSIPFACGFSLNIYNSIQAELLGKLKSKFISISPELTINEISDAAAYIENCEALCYGRVEVMVSEYCPIGAALNCKGKDCRSKQDIFLTDRMGMKFPVKTDIYCRSHIYNSVKLSMLENVKDLYDAGINIFRVNILDENKDEVYDIVKSFRWTADSLDKGSVNTPGALRRAVEGDYTRGNYYRGTE